MICSWCGTEILEYGSHFASYAGQPCKFAALHESRITRLDRGRSPEQIRRRTLRDLARTVRQDRGDQLLRDSVRQRDQHHEYRLRKRGLTQPPG